MYAHGKTPERNHLESTRQIVSEGGVSQRKSFPPPPFNLESSSGFPPNGQGPAQLQSEEEGDGAAPIQRSLKSQIVDQNIAPQEGKLEEGARATVRGTKLAGDPEIINRKGELQGSPPGAANPVGWSVLRENLMQHDEKLKGQYVRFHLINQQLGGEGGANGTYNLVPTTQQTNLSSQWRNFEEKAKTHFKKDRWIYFKAHVDYHEGSNIEPGFPKKISAQYAVFIETLQQWSPTESIELDELYPIDDPRVSFETVKTTFADVNPQLLSKALQVPHPELWEPAIMREDAIQYAKRLIHMRDKYGLFTINDAIGDLQGRSGELDTDNMAIRTAMEARLEQILSGENPMLHLERDTSPTPPPAPDPIDDPQSTGMMTRSKRREMAAEASQAPISIQPPAINAPNAQPSENDVESSDSDSDTNVLGQSVSELRKKRELLLASQADPELDPSSNEQQDMDTDSADEQMDADVDVPTDHLAAPPERRRAIKRDRREATIGATSKSRSPLPKHRREDHTSGFVHDFRYRMTNNSHFRRTMVHTAMRNNKLVGRTLYHPNHAESFLMRTNDVPMLSKLIEAAGL